MSLGMLYFLGVVLPNLSIILGLVFGVSILIVIPALCFYFNGNGCDRCYGYCECTEGVGMRKKALKFIKVCFVGAMISLILNIFLPSSSQVYKVAGAYIVTNTANIEKLPDNLVGAANSFLKKLKEENE